MKDVVVLVLSPLLEAILIFYLTWHGSVAETFEDTYAFGNSIIDLAFAAFLRWCGAVALVLACSCAGKEAVLLLATEHDDDKAGEFKESDEGNGEDRLANGGPGSSIYSTGDPRLSLPPLSQPLLAKEETKNESKQNKDEKIEMNETEKTLVAHVGARSMLVWCLFFAQALLVGCKCLTRISIFAGRGSDWSYWVAVTLALFLPALQAQAMVKLLSGALEARRRREGWLAKDGRRQQEARLGDMMQLVLIDWPLLVFAISGLTVAAAGESFIPYLYGQIIESITDSASEQRFKDFMLLLVIVAAVTGLATGVRGSTFIVLGARFSTRLRQKLFDQLLILEVGFYDETKTGDVSSRLTADCQKVGDQVELNVNVFLRSILQAALTISFMYWLNWRLATLAFITVPNVVLASKIFGNYMRTLTKKVQKALAESTAAAEEALSSMRTVKTHAAEQEMSRRYAVHLKEYRRLSMFSAAVYFPFSALTYTFLPYCASCLVLYYGGKLVNNDKCSNGELVSFVFYMQSLFATFSSLGSIYVGLVQAVGAADKVYEWCHREPKASVPPAGHGLRPDACHGQLEIRGVSFRYPQRPDRLVLDNLSISSPPGQVLALCGPSGGGKSSIMALLQNWYEPEQGDIFLDGVSIRALDQKWFHRKVAMVSQEPTLYGRTVYENILLGLDANKADDESGNSASSSSPSSSSSSSSVSGLEGYADAWASRLEAADNGNAWKDDNVQGCAPTREEVYEACRLANAYDFITAMPKGFDTPVGERGAQLSGGQRQRIAIARALVRKPAVLLLDEATSALDAESEYQVQSAIDSMIERGGITVVIIAHRLSTIRKADRIVVIEAGKVVEMGNHSSLMQKEGGHYASLAKRQLAPNPAVPSADANKDEEVKSVA